MKQVIGIIPARAGSRRLPNKNIRMIGGKTLIERAIECARASRLISQLVITTDIPSVLESPPDGVVCLERPAHLATDEASSIDVIRHVCESVGGFDAAVLLQPTSPLRSPDDVDRCVELLLGTPGATCVATVSRSAHPIEWSLKRDGGEFSPLFGWEKIRSPSHALDASYAVNGAVYAFWLNTLGDHLLGEGTLFVEIDQERGLDIDTELDFQIADAIFQRPQDTR